MTGPLSATALVTRPFSSTFAFIVTMPDIFNFRTISGTIGLTLVMGWGGVMTIAGSSGFEGEAAGTVALGAMATGMGMSGPRTTEVAGVGKL